MQFEELLDNLYEVYADSGKPEDKTYSIYKNPSNSERKKMIEEGGTAFDGFRILLDLKKRDIYLFDSRLLHAEASKILFGQEFDGSESGYRLGFASNIGKILYIKNFSGRTSADKKKYNEIKEWVSKKSRLTWSKNA